MASALTVLQEWAGDSADKQRLLKTKMELAVRWLNNGQLHFVNKSLCLRDVWTPNVPSSGVIALPDDFIQEFPDRVKRNKNNVGDIFLTKEDYRIANARYWAGLYAYSTYMGNFYIWSAQSATPSVPYCKKPAIILSKDIATAELEIPTEVHSTLLIYLEAKYGTFSKELKITEQIQLIELFEEKARHYGVIYALRMDKSPKMRGGFF